MAEKAFGLTATGIRRTAETNRPLRTVAINVNQLSAATQEPRMISVIPIAVM